MVPMLVSLIGGVVACDAVGFYLGPVVLAATLALVEVWRSRAAYAAFEEHTSPKSYV